MLIQQIPMNSLIPAFHNSKLEVTALLTFCNIQIEEVTVKNCLDHTSNNSYEVKKSLKIVAPNPVD